MLAFITPLAQAAQSAEEESSNFLVSPDVGLMIWTFLAFIVALLVLRKYAWPAITQALDKRQRAIEESIDTAEKARADAAALLDEYRQRLREAREQAQDIVVRARKAADNLADETKANASRQREELLAATRRDIEHETRRAIDEIRKEVADMTIVATEKVTRKSLTPEDHRELIEEALGEVDFSALAGKEGNGRDR
jgi:F-type H+-transporting ATPase subunit b